MSLHVSSGLYQFFSVFTTQHYLSILFPFILVFFLVFSFVDGSKNSMCSSSNTVLVVLCYDVIGLIYFFLCSGCLFFLFSLKLVFHWILVLITCSCVIRAFQQQFGFTACAMLWAVYISWYVCSQICISCWVVCLDYCEVILFCIGRFFGFYLLGLCYLGVGWNI